MAEYIEREAAIDKHCAICKDNSLCYRSRESCPEVKAFNSMPSADAQPVRHGWWISDSPGKRFGTVVRLDKDGCTVDSCHCSECGEWLTASDEYPVIGYYCPNCGAKMDEEVDT